MTLLTDTNAATSTEPEVMTAKKMMAMIEEVKVLMDSPQVIIVCHPDAPYDGEMTMRQAMDKGIINTSYVMLNDCIDKGTAYEIDPSVLEFQLPVCPVICPPILPTIEELLDEMKKENMDVDDLCKGYC